MENLEKVEAREDDIDFVIKAMSLISKLKPNKGSIPCPKCMGNLHYTRSKVNGHIWGKCQTEGCLSWIQ